MKYAPDRNEALRDNNPSPDGPIMSTAGWAFTMLSTSKVYYQAAIVYRGTRKVLEA
jgi:hypothetical protein